jgi:hypothetical protein
MNAPCQPQTEIASIDAAIDALMRAAIAHNPHAPEITLSLAIDPPKRSPAANAGRAGGLTRARSAIRAPDGRFLSSAEIAAIMAERSARAARGGRVRAALARRDGDGRFLADC